MTRPNLPAAFALIACLAAYTAAHYLPEPTRSWVQVLAFCGAMWAGVMMMSRRRGE
jgi:uncharacterized membrane protein YccC